MSVFGNDKTSWEYRLLGAIIRLNIECYNNPLSSHHDRAKQWLFGNAGKYDDKGRPMNKLEFWLSYTDIDPDVIRRHLKKPDDLK